VSVLDIVVGPIFKIIDKVIPDPAAKAAFQIEMLKLNQSSEFKQLDAELEMARNQTDINKVEAGSSNLFVSGWRPFIGWACGFIFCANYIGVPLMAWASGIYGWPAPPRLEIGEILPVLLGMLGLGGLRTAEKIKGAA
jgi:hypothetical protein